MGSTFSRSDSTLDRLLRDESNILRIYQAQEQTERSRLISTQPKSKSIKYNGK